MSSTKVLRTLLSVLRHSIQSAWIPGQRERAHVLTVWQFPPNDAISWHTPFHGTRWQFPLLCCHFTVQGDNYPHSITLLNCKATIPLKWCHFLVQVHNSPHFTVQGNNPPVATVQGSNAPHSIVLLHCEARIPPCPKWHHFMVQSHNFPTNEQWSSQQRHHFTSCCCCSMSCLLQFEAPPLGSAVYNLLILPLLHVEMPTIHFVGK